jgi:predicted nicotinamide N-methyase
MVSLPRIRYQTVEFGDMDIHVRTLRDHMQYLDVDGIAENLGISSATWPIFGVIWDSGRILARHMAEFKIAGKRILEVGCGIGLASLVLNHRLADITATDYHPEAESFLMKNVVLNKGKTIPFFRAGWEDEAIDLGRFDLVIGSDLLYERGHAGLLSRFIDQHANPRCEVVLVDPGRGNQGRFTRCMAELGYAGSGYIPENAACAGLSFKGRILTYLR